MPAPLSTARRITILIAALALAIPLFAPQALAQQDSVPNDILQSDIGSGVLIPDLQMECCLNSGQGLRFAGAGAKFDFQKLSNGNYLVEAACYGAGGPDAVSVVVTCDVNGQATTIGFPGPVGVVPQVASNVVAPLTICSTAVVTYALVPSMRAQACAQVSFGTRVVTGALLNPVPDA